MVKQAVEDAEVNAKLNGKTHKKNFSSLSLSFLPLCSFQMLVMLSLCVAKLRT